MLHALMTRTPRARSATAHSRADLQVDPNHYSFDDNADVTFLADAGAGAMRVRELLYGLRAIEGFAGAVALAGLPSTRTLL